MVFAAVVGGIYVALGPTVGAVITIVLAEALRIGFGTRAVGWDNLQGSIAPSSRSSRITGRLYRTARLTLVASFRAVQQILKTLPKILPVKK